MSQFDLVRLTQHLRPACRRAPDSPDAFISSLDNPPLARPAFWQAPTGGRCIETADGKGHSHRTLPAQGNQQLPPRRRVQTSPFIVIQQTPRPSPSRPRRRAPPVAPPPRHSGRSRAAPADCGRGAAALAPATSDRRGWTPLLSFGSRAQLKQPNRTGSCVGSIDLMPRQSSWAALSSIVSRLAGVRHDCLGGTRHRLFISRDPCRRSQTVVANRLSRNMPLSPRVTRTWRR